MKHSITLITFFVTLLASCTNNSFDEVLFRTTDDPFYEAPKVESDLLENTIYVSWSEDKACDCFYLMKSYDQASLDFKCIYSGNDLSFKDIKIDTYDCYVYRLDKKRGNKVFKGNEYSYGYGSACRKDTCEPNNDDNAATFLEYDLECNLYCVQYLTDGGSILYDKDWFYIVLPPYRNGEIVVSQKNLENSSQGAETNLMVLVAGSSEEAIREKTGFTIRNTKNFEQKFYFMIFPNTTAVFQNGKSCTSIEYTIALNRIYK